MVEHVSMVLVTYPITVLVWMDGKVLTVIAVSVSFRIVYIIFPDVAMR